jgi:hypothetical protein
MGALILVVWALTAFGGKVGDLKGERA